MSASMDADAQGQALWKLGNPYPADWIELPEVWLARDNPRRGDIETIAFGIQSLGWFGRVIVQAHSKCQGGPRILAGNHRTRAGISIGMTRFPVEIIDCSDDEGDRILIADNRHSDLARWNDHLLAETLQGLTTLEGTGYTDQDLDRLLASLNRDDAIPDDREPPATGVRVQVGTISFTISRAEWDIWEAELSTETGARFEDQVAEVRSRLQI